MFWDMLFASGFIKCDTDQAVYFELIIYFKVEIFFPDFSAGRIRWKIHTFFASLSFVSH